MDFTKMSMNELVTTYNEMVLTAVDKGLPPKFKVVKSFHDSQAGVNRCALLHALIHNKEVPAVPKKKPAAKKAAPKASSTRGRKSSIPDTAKISVLVDENPKRGRAKDNFAMYKEGMLVSTYKEKVGNSSLALATLRWDVKHKFIKLT